MVIEILLYKNLKKTKKKAKFENHEKPTKKTTNYKKTHQKTIFAQTSTNFQLIPSSERSFFGL